jgi:hypothetical protein
VRVERGRPRMSRHAPLPARRVEGGLRYSDQENHRLCQGCFHLRRCQGLIPTTVGPRESGPTRLRAVSRDALRGKPRRERVLLPFLLPSSSLVTGIRTPREKTTQGNFPLDASCDHPWRGRGTGGEHRESVCLTDGDDCSSLGYVAAQHLVTLGPQSFFGFAMIELCVPGGLDRNGVAVSPTKEVSLNSMFWNTMASVCPGRLTNLAVV